jgi:hypothetical protein
MDPKGCWALVAVAATFVGVAGCATPSARPPGIAVSASAGATSSADQTPAGKPPTPTAPASGSGMVPDVGQASLDDARKLGGTSHKGQSLYFVIGESMGSEAAARAALAKATPLFGDMQSYFIVQRSDSFEGMRPGWWVVTEAYRAPPSAESLQFARRGFPNAYVKRAVVRTADPIPVYEDLVPGAGQ